MIFNYVENILKCAKDGLQKPEDFGYWGSDDMFKTWGFCGVDKNRDSDIREISNFEVITKDLMSRFPLDFRIENYSHWMVGNVDRLVCRILKYEIPFIDQVKQEDITAAFISAMEWLDQLRDYPVADEGDYSDKEYEQSIAEIIEWDKDNINFYVDDFLYHSVKPNDVPGDWVFNQSFYLILNVAVGGNLPGSPNSQTSFPQSMLVDYIRVYE